MTQNELIRQALEAGRKLTPLMALREFGTLRLGARVWDLKQEGLSIKSELVMVRTRSGKARVARYFL